MESRTESHASLLPQHEPEPPEHMLQTSQSQDQDRMSTTSASSAVVGGVNSMEEIDFLKDTVGPPLIAALADLVIRRPTDPIEFLGHRLIQWKFSQELKKQDVKTALELVQQKEWKKYQHIIEFTSDGFTPQNPYGPIGYGGPVFEGEPEIAAAAVENEENVENVEQLYSHPPFSSYEIVGEYGDQHDQRFPYYQHHDYAAESGEDSERPISYYTQPSQAQTVISTAVSASGKNSLTLDAENL